MKRLLVISILVLLTFLLPVVDADSVSVDFSQDLGTINHRASGFIGYIRKDIPLNRIRAVKPTSIRDDSDYGWQVASLSGATVSVTLSQGALDGEYNGRFQDYVDEVLMPLINRAKSKGQPYNYVIWNEPDHFGWPGGTESSWWTWWEDIYDIIRTNDPGVDILGPSYSYYEPSSEIKNFLTYCKTNNCVPDALDWHSWRSNVGQLEADIADITGWMSSNGVSINKIFLSEYNSRNPNDNAKSPGHAVAVFFGPGERQSIVKGMQKSIFDWDMGSPSFNYLLTVPNHDPTSLWYTYKYYADMEGRLAMVTRGSYVDGVAVKNSSEIRAIFGRTTGSDSINVYLNNLNSVSFLSGAGNAHVKVARIDYSADQISYGPEEIINQDYSITGNQIHITVSGIGARDAFTVLITSAGPSNCGNGNCDSGECNSCPQDCTRSECINDGYCSTGLKDGDENCGNSPSDCACAGNELCCNDQCISVCFQDSDCGSDPCKDYTCSNPGTCSSSCSYQDITSCTDNDGCCPSGCTEDNDKDCKIDYCDGLVMLFHLDNQPEYGENDTYFYDFSGNGNNGTCTGVSCPVFDTAGKFEGSYEFDGSNDYIETLFYPDGNTRTLNYWINLDTTAQHVMGVNDGAGHRFYLGPFSSSAFYGGCGSNYDSSLSIPKTLQTGTWHMFTMVREGNTAEVYLDGEYGDSFSCIFSGTSTVNFAVGALNDASPPPSSFMYGTIDEVAVWNRSLNESEIQNLYNSGNPISCEAYCHPADTDCDSCIEMTELMAYIAEWKAGSVTMTSLMDAIGLWKAGC